MDIAPAPTWARSSRADRRPECGIDDGAIDTWSLSIVGTAKSKNGGVHFLAANSDKLPIRSQPKRQDAHARSDRIDRDQGPFDDLEFGLSDRTEHSAPDRGRRQKVGSDLNDARLLPPRRSPRSPRNPGRSSPPHGRWRPPTALACGRMSSARRPWSGFLQKGNPDRRQVHVDQEPHQEARWRSTSRSSALQAA